MEDTQKIIYKKMSISVPEDTYNRFRRYCRKNSKVMSAVISKFMKREVESIGE